MGFLVENKVNLDYNSFMRDRIEAILNKVRPQLEADGGGIELVDYKDGVVRVKFIGACSTCPMASITLKNVVEVALRQELPEVKQVVAL